LEDDKGAIRLTQSYDPYGNVLNSYGEGTTIYGYDGEQQDSAGMVYLRARYYDLNIGQFVQADAVTAGGPQGLKRYSYGLNNPVNTIDPSGFFGSEVLLDTLWMENIISANNDMPGDE